VCLYILLLLLVCLYLCWLGPWTLKTSTDALLDIKIKKEFEIVKRPQTQPMIFQNYIDVRRAVALIRPTTTKSNIEQHPAFHHQPTFTKNSPRMTLFTWNTTGRRLPCSSGTSVRHMSAWICPALVSVRPRGERGRGSQGSGGPIMSRWRDSPALTSIPGPVKATQLCAALTRTKSSVGLWVDNQLDC